jgi:hypothetical protein
MPIKRGYLLQCAYSEPWLFLHTASTSTDQVVSCVPTLVKAEAQVHSRLESLSFFDNRAGRVGGPSKSTAVPNICKRTPDLVARRTSRGFSHVSAR